MLCLNVTTMGQTPVGTGFTYQGLLREASQPATGAYDIHVSLWDAAAGGAQVGGAQCFDDVAVNDGLFTVRPDFGAQFDGNQRFVQIAVRPAGAAGDCAVGGYTVLTPRQALTATPYAATALRALDVVGADRHSLDAADGSPTDAVFVNNDGNVGIGTTTPAARLDVNGGVRVAADNEIRFADNGQIVAGDDNHQIRFRRSENILEFREIGRFVFKPGLLSTIPHESEFRVVIDQYARVGIGIDVPTQQLDVLGDALIRGRHYFVHPGQVATLNLGNESNSIRGIFGSGLRLGVFQVPDAVAIQEVSGNFGIGTTTPAARLDVNGGVRVAADNEIRFADNGQIVSSDDSHRIHFRRSENILELREFGKILLSTGPEPELTNSQVVIDAIGRLGIGNTAPTERLDVLGNGLIRGPSFSSPGQEAALFFGNTANSIRGIFGNGMRLGVSQAPDAIAIQEESGNVGIGTTSPAEKLSVNGMISSQIGGFRFPDGSVQTTAAMITPDIEYWREEAGHLSNLNTGGVGIGTTDPNGQFEVSVRTGAESIDINNDRTADYTQESQIWQSFIPSRTGALSRVELFLQSPSIDSVTANVQIFRGEGISGQLLAESSIILQFGVGRWYSTTFDAPPQVVPGSQYTIFVTYPPGSIVNTSGEQGNPYPLGITSQCTHGVGCQWDIAFRTYLQAPDRSSALVVANSGRTGLGVTAPTKRLDVAGDAHLRGESGFTATGDQAILSLGIANNYVAGVYGSGLHFGAFNVADGIVLRENTGNVGIGTSAPTERLSVSGTIQSLTGGFRFPDGSVQTTAAFAPPPVDDFWNASGANIFNSNPGNVGIGVSSPSQRLHVRGNALFEGQDGWSAAGHRARLNLGDTNNYVAAEYGVGLRLGVFNKPDAVTIEEDSGNVGVGVLNPETRLHVRGLALFENAAGTAGTWLPFVNGDVYITADEAQDAGNIFFRSHDPVAGYRNWMTILAESGHVGIGTSSPSRKLDVAGDAIVRGATFAQGGDRAGLTLGVNGIEIAGVYGSGLRLSAFGAPDAVTVQENTGNVGIGTTSPTNRLSIAGNANVSGNLTLGGGATVGTDLDVLGGATIGTDLLVNGSTTFDGSAQFDGSARFNGSANFSNPIEVSESINIEPFSPGDTTSVTMSGNYIQSDSSGIRLGRVAGFFGVDLLSLNTNDTIELNGATDILGETRIFGNTSISGQLVTTQPLQTPHIKATDDLYIEKGIADLNDQWLRVYTWDQAAQREQFRIQDGVNADVKADGTFLSNGLDYAEAFKTEDESIEAGDVVCLQIGNWENCQKTTQAYSQNIIGVVSNQAGFICGMSFDAENEADAEIARRRDEARNNMALARQNGDENAYNAAVAEEKRHTQTLLAKVQQTHRPVALVGRVPCKVDGRFGPIRAGDRLTASPTPGCAMKQTQPGPSIGVALEDWDGGGMGRVMTFVQPGWHGSSATPTAVTAGEVSFTELAATVAALQAEVARLRDSLSNGKR